MRQVLIKDGSVVITDVPAPGVSARNVLVQVAYSCISGGTEMVSVRNSGVPLYRRALQQPQHVRRVLDMVREQGLNYALDRIRGKLASGSPTGYSAAGRVVAIGSEVEGFAVGDIVACAGAGIANHAEFIDVPVNLAARVPAGVALRDASTVTLGAIALQGVRRAQPTLGETVVVSGLGLLGLLTVQLLRAHGCAVIGVDPHPARRGLAEHFGATALDPGDGLHVDQVTRLSDGMGADAVIVTAAGRSDEIVSQAFRCCRRKGRVVIVGDVGLNLQRADFYAKEIDLLISASYGPGRYDPLYEEAGQDYPLGYVRWTENRNMTAYLGLLHSGAVRLEPLGPQEFPVEQAARAYEALGSASGMLALLRYAGAEPAARTVTLHAPARPRSGRLRVALIGAGGFAQGMHLPNLQRLREQFELHAVISKTGANARAVAQQYGASYAGTDYTAVLSDKDVDLVIVATRHDLHARVVLEALRAGKNVLCEKPLALTAPEVDQIEDFYAGTQKHKPLLMTGYNRRFAPAMQRVRSVLAARSSPVLINYRVNAGHIAASHWVHGPEGGGRNIGEGCHFYDLFQFLTASQWMAANASSIAAVSRHYRSDDNFVATVRYQDGSLCTLTYTAMGAKQYPKERMDLFCDGYVVSVDDYRSLAVVGRADAGWSAKSAEKGQFEELQALGAALRGGGPWPISLADQLAVPRLAIEVQRQLLGTTEPAGLRPGSSDGEPEGG